MDGVIFSSPGTTLEEIEKQVIQQRLQFYRGNKTTTAQSLGIAIRTLDSKLAKYDEDDKAQQVRLEDERKRREDFQRRSRGVAVAQPNGQMAAAGVHVEPAKVATEKRSVPVPERQEVQSMPPKQAAGDYSRRGR